MADPTGNEVLPVRFKLVSPNQGEVGSYQESARDQGKDSDQYRNVDQRHSRKELPPRMPLEVTSDLYPFCVPAGVGNQEQSEPFGGRDWSAAIQAWNSYLVKQIVKSSHGKVGAKQFAIKTAIGLRFLNPLVHHDLLRV